MRKMTKYILLIVLFLTHSVFSQSKCWFVEFTKDYDKNPVDFKAFVANDPDAMYVYQQLFNANRVGLKKNIKALEQYSIVIKNKKLKELGFTDELLANVRASRLDDGDFATILADLDKFGKKMVTDPVEFENFKNIISKLTDKNPQNSQAAHWILQDITENTIDFIGKKWGFEVRVTNLDSNNAFIDLASFDSPPMRIEYKWLTSQIISKDDFIREFIKRDLFNLEDFSKLQWRIKGKKISQEKVLEYMSSKEGREALNNPNIINIIDGYAAKMGYQNDILSVNDLLEFFKNNNMWYKSIFK